MTPETTTGDATLRELREQVSETDRTLVELVNSRLELVQRIWRRKEELDLPIVDPQREQSLLHDLEQRNRGPLTADGLRELHAYLLALTKRELEGR